MALIFAGCKPKTVVNCVCRNINCSIDEATCVKLAEKLGTSGTLVFILATRLGYGDQVRAVLTEHSGKCD